MNDIYEKIYNEVEKNHISMDSSKLFPKEAYLVSLESNSIKVDISKINNYDNEMYLYAAYMLLLDRTPDENALKNWSKNFEMSNVEFRKAVLKTLISAREFKLRNIELEGNYLLSKYDIYKANMILSLKSGVKKFIR